MKLLSVTVPCYNSQAYMRKAIDSLLTGGERVEILVVDDGSKDETAAIGEEYAQRYPSIVRLIRKENGGHGDAVMTGLTNSQGLYFKVVDSDDWVDGAALLRALDTLENHTGAQAIDMLVCNYVYDKVGVRHKHVMRYRENIPRDRVFGWDEARFFMSKYLLMHSVIYRTQLLRDCGLSLPKHTFYVDELYVYLPLPHVEKMLYLDVDLYHYFIGREDQSVQEKVMIGRIDQALLVNRLMVTGVDLATVDHRRKRAYMRNFVEIVTTVSSVLAYKSGLPENFRKKEELWAFIKKEQPRLYKELRFRPIGVALHLPGPFGRWVSITGYCICQKIFGFN